ASSMTWKGLYPILSLSKTVYQKGISLTKKAMKQVESRLQRSPVLPKWDILIQPLLLVISFSKITWRHHNICSFSFWFPNLAVCSSFFSSSSLCVFSILNGRIMSI
ncbi:MAG: hypothetical protein HRU34_22035, partial [Richelia sp.]|nr:hypothetical protein [Richelia sp.]